MGIEIREAANGSYRTRMTATDLLLLLAHTVQNLSLNLPSPAEVPFCCPLIFALVSWPPAADGSGVPSKGGGGGGGGVEAS